MRLLLEVALVLASVGAGYTIADRIAARFGR